MQRVFKSARSYGIMFLIPLGLFAVMLVAFEEITLGNVPSLFKQALFPTVLSCGLMFNFACGNWDLAIGAEAVLSAILAGRLAVSAHLGVPGPASSSAACWWGPAAGRSPAPSSMSPKCPPSL